MITITLTIKKTYQISLASIHKSSWLSSFINSSNEEIITLLGYVRTLSLPKPIIKLNHCKYKVFILTIHRAHFKFTKIIKPFIH